MLFNISFIHVPIWDEAREVYILLKSAVVVGTVQYRYVSTYLLLVLRNDAKAATDLIFFFY